MQRRRWFCCSFIGWVSFLALNVATCTSARAAKDLVFANVEVPDPPYAIVVYPSSQVNSQGTAVAAPGNGQTFALVQLQPDQGVQVTLQFSTDRIGQAVQLAALDGGTVLPAGSVAAGGNSTGPIPTPTPLPDLNPLFSGGPLLPIDATARVTFTFVATHNPGRNQVNVRIFDPANVNAPATIMGVQFWVADASNPQNNPVAISATNSTW